MKTASPDWPSHSGEPAREIAAALEAPTWPAHGRLPLGNRRDPLDELFFILLTTMTQYGALQAFRAVRAEFRPWRSLLEGGAEYRLRDLIAPLGLSHQKAPRLVAIARRLQDDFSVVSLSAVREMGDPEAEEYLLSLPGVGVKVANCVLMYSFGRRTCPVDTHVHRVACRTGLIPSDTSYPKAHGAVQAAVPPTLRYGLHVAFVRLGRKVCTAKAPKCGDCPLGKEGLCSSYPVGDFGT